VVVAPYAELARATGRSATTTSCWTKTEPQEIVPFVRVGDRFLPSLNMAAAIIAAGLAPAQVRVDGPDLRLGDRQVPLLNVSSPRFAAQAGARPRPDRWLIRFSPAPRCSKTARPRRIGPTLLRSSSTRSSNSSPARSRHRSRRVPRQSRHRGHDRRRLHDIFSVPLGFDRQDAGNQIPWQCRGRCAVERLRGLGRGAVAGATGAVRSGSGPGVGRCGSVGDRVHGVGDRRRAWAGAACGCSTVASGSGCAAGRRLGWRPSAAWRTATSSRVSEKRKVKRLFSALRSHRMSTASCWRPDPRPPRGQRREMTVLFSDIRGFHNRLDAGSREEIVAQLNEYFSRMGGSPVRAPRYPRQVRRRHGDGAVLARRRG